MVCLSPRPSRLPRRCVSLRPSHLLQLSILTPVARAHGRRYPIATLLVFPASIPSRSPYSLPIATSLASAPPSLPYHHVPPFAIDLYLHASLFARLAAVVAYRHVTRVSRCETTTAATSLVCRCLAQVNAYLSPRPSHFTASITTPTPHRTVPSCTVRILTTPHLSSLQASSPVACPNDLFYPHEGPSSRSRAIFDT